jgi:hypothetical protein
MPTHQEKNRTKCFGSGFFLKLIDGKPVAFGRVVTHDDKNVVVDWYEDLNASHVLTDFIPQQTIPLELVTKEGNYWEHERQPGTSDQQSR